MTVSTYVLTVSVHNMYWQYSLFQYLQDPKSGDIEFYRSIGYWSLWGIILLVETQRSQNYNFVAFIKSGISRFWKVRRDMFQIGVARHTTVSTYCQYICTDTSKSGMISFLGSWAREQAGNLVIIKKTSLGVRPKVPTKVSENTPKWLQITQIWTLKCSYQSLTT